MIRSFLLVSCLAIAPPAAAGEGVEKGFDLLGEGSRLVMEGLMQELAPALEGLRDGLEALDAYHPPEILPNGDIIIRRKRPVARIDPEDGIEL